MADCDIYFDWRGGSDGNVLTTAIAQASFYPASPGAAVAVYPSSPASVLSVEADSACTSYSGTFTTGGSTYNVSSVTQGLIFSHATTASENVTVIPTTTKADMSMGFFYKTTLHTSLYLQYGQCGIEGEDDGDWAILSTYIDESGNAHSCMETNSGLFPATAANGPTLEQNTWYWITILYSTSLEKAYLATFLASTMAQVGGTVEADLVATPPNAWRVDYGQVASEGNSEAGASSWYSSLAVDWTDATFPLLPSAASGGSANIVQMIV